MQMGQGHEIGSIQAGSIAGELGLQAGDLLLLIDGQPLRDVFDYRMRQLCEKLVLTVQTGDGELIEYDIEKDEDEDLGLEFVQPLLDDCLACENHCVFCFIDQLPAGLRPSLYFKDDDLRLSFLTGNYVTLTNLPGAELDRLIAYRLSPMNISVHATDAKLRQKMMRHREAGQILERLRRITAAGIAVNVQIVLCPGLNDGAALHQTISDLVELGCSIRSIAVVPVGLTRFREGNGLYQLQPLTPGDAAAVLDTVQAWQARMLRERQERLVYAADEIYLKAGRPLPPASDFEDFPQLENGVGMASLMRDELTAGLAAAVRDFAEPAQAAWPQRFSLDDTTVWQPRTAVMITGTAAGPLFEPFLPALAERSGLDLRLAVVPNRFFGLTITVAGLLTGQDILVELPAILKATSNIPDENPHTCLIVPDCLLKAGEDLLLDNCTLQQLADQLDIPVFACPADAAGLLGLLDWFGRKPGQPGYNGRSETL